MGETLRNVVDGNVVVARDLSFELASEAEKPLPLADTLKLSLQAFLLVAWAFLFLLFNARCTNGMRQE